MAVIFISHSSEDRPSAEELSRRLRDQGYQAVFVDFDVSDGIPAGRAWESELYAALRRSDAVVFLATNASVNSRWCFAEMALARSLGVPVFALRAAEGARLSLIDDVQWVDLAEGESAYRRLWNGMRRAHLDPAESRGWDPTRSPYPGLHAFSEADAGVFFARSEETRHLVELVQPTLLRGSGRWITIVGPSGSGKSSLLLAGLLPSLARAPDRWILVPTFTPGRRPTRQLAGSLARALTARGMPHSAAELEDKLADPTTGSATLIQIAEDLSNAAGSSPRVLLAIDQAEEIINRVGEQEQRAFLRLIKNATGAESPLWVVCTLRSEYLSTAPERAGMSEVTDDSLVLEPLSRNRLSEVIAGPARRAGLEFDAGLVERMVEETTGGDALPLLAHTLYELARRASSEEKRLIRLADYEVLGGVVGALQRRADQVLRELAARGRALEVMPTLLKLVTLDHDGLPVRRRVVRTTLTDAELEVVDGFVEARLLSSDRGEGTHDEATVEVTHEALLRQWQPLRSAIEESRTTLQMRAELEREAADWAAGGREESYLLRGARLAGLVEWVSAQEIELGDLEAEFLESSRQLASKELRTVQVINRRLRRLLIGVAALLVLAIAAGGVALQSTRKAEREANTALTRQLITQAGTLRGTRPDAALLLGVEAVRRAPQHLDREARVTLLQTLNRPFHVVTTHLPHPDAVRSVTFDPTGTLLATAGNDNAVRTWDLSETAPHEHELLGHTNWTQGVAFSPDGTTLASISHDQTIRLWDPVTGRPRGAPLRGHEAAVSGLVFSRDGSSLMTSSEDGTVRLWDLTREQPRSKTLIQLDTQIWNLALHRDGSLLATADADGYVRFWDVATGRSSGEPLARHAGWAISVAFSPDGSMLVESGSDGAVRLWDVATRTPLGQPMTGHSGEVSDVTFNNDGTVVASAGRDGTVRLWDTATRRPKGEPLTGHANAVRSVEFSPDGHHLASASFDNTVRLWQTEATLPGQVSLRGHSDRVTDVAFSLPDSSLLASASADGTVRLWSTAEDNEQRSVLRGHSGWVRGVAFSPVDGRLLASGGADGTVRLWDAEAGRPRGDPLRGHTDEVAAVAFSPDGELLASAGRDGTERVWDVASGRELMVMSSPGGQVLDVAFNDDGTTLATANEDGTVRFWDVATGQERWDPRARHTGWVLSLAYNADGNLVASGSGDGTIRRWAADSGRPSGRTLTGHLDEVNDVAFSPMTSTLISTSKDGTVRLWDVRTSQPIGEPLSGPAEPVTLDFARNGAIVAVGRDDGVVRLWNLRGETLIREACATANRNLTPDEWAALVGPAVAPRETCPGVNG